MLHEFIGQKIRKVTYFELHDPNNSFFFEGFDNFDFGIEIELSDDSHFHIGWKNNDRPEIGTGKFNARKYQKDFIELDATHQWSRNLNSAIRDIDVIYVLEEWNIPAKCTINFENDTSVSIILGEELNEDHSLPLPLTYNDCSEFYVFHGKELPEIEFVRIILPAEHEMYKDLEDDYEFKSRLDRLSWITIPALLMLGFLGIIVYQIIKYFLN